MARYETLVCDQCTKRARIPAIGWIRTITPSGVFIDPADVVPGDWCGTACLLAHFSDVVLQEPLDGLDEENSPLGASEFTPFGAPVVSGQRGTP